MARENFSVILVIGDLADEVIPLCMSLNKTEYRVITEKSAERFVEISLETRPLIIVFDSGISIFDVNNAATKSGIKNRSILPFMVFISENPEALENSDLLHRFSSAVIKKPRNSDDILDFIKPYIRLVNEQRLFEERTRTLELNFDARIKEMERGRDILGKQVEKLYFANQQLISENASGVVYNDILPPFLRLSPEVIAITAIADGRVIDVNDAVERVTGYTREEALKSSIIEKKLWASRYELKKMTEILVEKGSIHNFEARFRRKSGAIFPVLLSASSITFNNEFCIISMFVDISERRRSENLARARLLISEAGIFSCSIEDIIMKMLEEAEKLTESHIGFFHFLDEGEENFILTAWSASTMKVCATSAKNQIYPVSEAGIWAECVTSRKPVIHNDYLSSPGRKGLPKGHVPLLREAVIPVFHGEKIVAALGVGNKPWNYDDYDVDVLIQLSKMCHDIIMRRRAEDALKESELRLRIINEDLEQRVADRTAQLVKAKESAELASVAKSSFLANMSHELRTPLNAILGFSQLMAHEPDLSENQRKNIGIINRSGEHLLQLINNVLDMAKIESGHTVLGSVSFNFRRCFDDICNMFHMKAADRGLSLNFTIDEKLPVYMVGDEGKLRQILINLAGNAFKFTEQGSVSLVASRLMNGTADILRIEIKDTGNGISEDELEVLFRPFYQTPAGQVSGGTGLGLALSRQFAALMGGSLTAASKGHGSGSTFTLEIPLQQDDYGSYVTGSSLIRGLAPGQERYKILIAEDIRENRQLLSELLRIWGFDVRAASDGKEAVDIWEIWRPDLMFLDMRMPVMDGYETLEYIHSHPSVPKPFIVALTASTFESQKSSILAKGCDAFLGKPFREDDIAGMLEKYLCVKFLFEDIYKDEKRDLTSCFDFSEMDIKWLARLDKAIIDADAGMLENLADEIKTVSPGLAANLRKCAENFDYNPVIEALEKQGGHIE